MRLLVKARNFQQRPLFVQAWFLPLWVMLGAAKLAIRIFPFSAMAPRLGRAVPPIAPDKVGSPQSRQRAARIAEALRVSARMTPWTSDCFPKALAGVALLRLYGLPYVLTFGVQDGNEGLAAHCWLVSGSTAICGLRNAHRFSAVASFVHGEG